MQKLKGTRKITLATLKAFAKRNSDALFVKVKSDFDGMTDSVQQVSDDWRKTEITDSRNYYKTGIQGVYTVGRSRDFFEIYEDDLFIGIEISNSCGTTILATIK